MLPAINKNQQLTQHLTLTKTGHLNIPQKKKKVWLDQYRLIGISSPQVLDGARNKKIFKLRFFYKDDNTNKKHSHVIYFGDKSDYIFTNNKQQRNIQNPFHSDYWSAHLANKYNTLKQGLQKFTEFFLQGNNKQLKARMEKQLTEIK